MHTHTGEAGGELVALLLSPVFILWISSLQLLAPLSVLFDARHVHRMIAVAGLRNHFHSVTT
ncbi:MAG: hypothetical protein R3284_05860 [Rubricoccaceae bacterium]|nr:hypothetical protein [Rubricoccaceae bacterium]